MPAAAVEPAAAAAAPAVVVECAVARQGEGMAQAASEILLVDDDPDLLKLIGLRLTSAGYRVRTTR